MSNLHLRPSLHFGWPLPVQPVIRCMSAGLANLEQAAAGDLLGFELMHGLGARYTGGAVSEYQCSLIGTGDGRSCDGTVIRLAPHARSLLNTLLPHDLEAGALARIFHWVLGAPNGEFETAHFANFTIAVLYDYSSDQPDIREVRIFSDPVREACEAERRVAEIKAIFAFLGEWHTLLSRYRIDLPTPDMLYRAA
ncbi:hypothetical protein [Aquicoccus sp. SU-CL01552]|uniref:hypothetical protein n=1 Tax=Aquicoccus sp. SU-CL01552 TaxID=3127656 RepID=UPI00310A762E